MAKVKQGEKSMQKLVLTRDAFDRFYGSTRLIVMAEGVYKPLVKIVPASLDILLLNRAGSLYTPQEDAPKTAACLAPVGAPVGLLGFVVDKKMKDSADAWSNWSAAQTGRATPPVWLIKAGDTVSALQCLAEAAVTDADSKRNAAATIQTDLAILRRDFERSLINLEKARRIIRGAGYDTRYSTMTVPIGEKSVCPKGVTSPLAPYILRYGLPVDAAGVLGISLHCVVPKGELADGHLTVLIKRSVDARVLGRAQVPFSSVSTGWLYLELERGLQRSFGDAELVFEWVVNTEGGVPAISLTDGEPVRCGTLADGKAANSNQPDRALPAMQIWSGFAPGDLADDREFLGTPVEDRRAAVRNLLSRAKLMAGGSAEEDVVSVEGTAGWVQTHLQAGVPVGFVFEQLVPAPARTLTVTCETAHASAPTCYYAVAVGGSLVLSEDYMAGLLEQVKVSGAPTGFDADTGILWRVEAVAPGMRCEIEIDLSVIDDDLPALQLAMAVISTSDKTDYGWCRWHDVSVKLDTITDHSVVHGASTMGQPLIQRMRSVKFPEIGERLEFLAGRAKLQALTDQLGFSPMIIADDNGSLQTHPIKQDMSAVLYRSGAGVGTTRVACDVETAHERAPDFMYILALLDAETPDKYEVFKAFAGNLMSGEFSSARGYDTEYGLHYTARRLSALQVEALSVDLDEPLGVEHDIIVAALSVHDIISYGWCRWLSLSVATVIDTHQQFDLKSVDV